MRSDMANWINKATIFILISSSIGQSLAASDSENFKAGFESGVITATHLQEHAFNAMKTFKPEATFKNFNSNPNESNYKNHPDGIKNDALTSKSNNQAAKAINESIQSHLQVNLQNDLSSIDKVMTRSEQMNNNVPCQTGDCVQTKKQADKDFQKAASAFAAGQEAAKSFTEFNSIFSGYPSSCDRVTLGYIDCCSEKGWGKDIHLARCSSAEKDLALAKQNMQTIYIGEYCKDRVLGVCVEHRKGYCVFPSKIARIIQQQGRAGQLHIGFGKPNAPNCKGLTRQQFAELNFEKIDFSGFYSDLINKTPLEDLNNINRRIANKLNKMSQEKKANG